ncbi:MAG: DUF6464 family protein [Cyanobacteriota bacterium]|nr:DUF6464 family protein [Cyanobacteriota bacterium]
MLATHLPIRVIDVASGDLLAELVLTEHPHPGGVLQVDQQPYLVLEKRHSYWLRNGRYCLVAIRVLVRSIPEREGSDADLIGDPSCRYNARSQLLRCAVNPDGPCQGCHHYQPQPASLK